MELLPPSGWELAAQLAKLLMYLGVAGLAGGTVCLLFYRDESRRGVVWLIAYIGLCGLLGFNGALFAFLFQVGQASGAGFGGMFDMDMASLLLGFEVGSASLLRLGGYLSGAVACLAFAVRLGSRPPPRTHFLLLGAVNAFALLPVLASFTITGHIAVLDAAAKAAVVLHMLAAGIWIGALAPLLYLCVGGNGGTLAQTMKRFGDMAGYCLSLLFAAGFILVLRLFHTPGELIGTPYGLTLLIKLALVAALLLAAAGNRFVLVPRMLAGAGPGSLARAVRIEIFVAAAIFAVTSYLATSVGPPSMPMQGRLDSSQVRSISACGGGSAVSGVGVRVETAQVSKSNCSNCAAPAAPP